MTREELAKAIREDYERKGVWACKSDTINMQIDFEMLGIILEALEQESILNKIRAEIMQLYNEVEVVDYDHNDISRIKKAHWIIREEVIWIIDRYRGRKRGISNV